jgi:hypothetical protein
VLERFSDIPTTFIVYWYCSFVVVVVVVVVVHGDTNNMWLQIDEPTNRLFSGSWDSSIRVCFFFFFFFFFFDRSCVCNRFLIFKVWNLTTLKEMRCLKDHAGHVSCLKIFDGKLFSGEFVLFLPLVVDSGCLTPQTF